MKNIEQWIQECAEQLNAFRLYADCGAQFFLVDGQAVLRPMSSKDVTGRKVFKVSKYDLHHFFTSKQWNDLGVAFCEAAREEALCQNMSES